MAIGTEGLLLSAADQSKVAKLPAAVIYDRYLIPREEQSVFQRRASAFEDIVVRCMRYAFVNIPPRVGRVFLSREVSLPFLWFRLLRHGYPESPIHWREHCEVTAPTSFVVTGR